MTLEESAWRRTAFWRKKRDFQEIPSDVEWKWSSHFCESSVRGFKQEDKCLRVSITFQKASDIRLKPRSGGIFQEDGTANCTQTHSGRSPVMANKREAIFRWSCPKENNPVWGRTVYFKQTWFKRNSIFVKTWWLCSFLIKKCVKLFFFLRI